MLSLNVDITLYSIFEKAAGSNSTQFLYKAVLWAEL